MSTYKGSHPTMGVNSPQRPKEAIALKQAAPLHVVMPEPEEKKDVDEPPSPPFSQIEPAVRFVTAALLTAFPA